MRAEPEVRQLRAFVTVVEAGGFTRAAGALGVAQSTVSEAIHALERTLGTELFVKGRRAPTLTAAGERLLPGARRVLTTMDAVVREVTAGEAQARATVTLGTSESLSAYVLPDVLARLRREWPGTRYVVSTGPCPAIRREVREGRLDVGVILTASADDGDEESECLAEGRLWLFARPGHPLTARAAAIGEIADVTLYISDAAGDFWGRIHGYFESAGYPADRLQSAGSVEGVKRGVQADAEALGLLPEYAVAEDVARGTFARVEVRVPLPPVWIRAIWRRQTTLPARAAAIAERLRAAVHGGERPAAVR